MLERFLIEYLQFTLICRPNRRATRIEQEVTMRRAKGTPVLKRRLRERREKERERERENGSPLRFGDQTGALNCPRHNGVFRIIAFSVLRPIQERLAHSLPLSVSGWLWKLSSNLRNLRSTPRSASMWLVHVTPHEALRRTTWRRGPAEGTRLGSLCRHLISPGI